MSAARMMRRVGASDAHRFISRTQYLHERRENMKRITHKILMTLQIMFIVSAHSLYAGQPPGGGEFTMCRIRKAPEENINREVYSFSQMAGRAVEHVVNISTVRVIRRSPGYDDPDLRRYFGPEFDPRNPPEHIENSLGSGVFISEDGYVVTNYHVIENAGLIKVTFSGQREFDAEIVGADPGTDIALIRLKGDYSEVTPVEFADSDSVRIGDMVLAIGSPFSLRRSVSMGIVSGKSRADFGIVEYEDFIQTDAAINPGNSGGALMNMYGALIGINTAILSGSGGSHGVGFAVPSNMVLEVVEQILRHGRVMRGSLGVAVQQVNQDIMDAFGLTSERGVIVTRVVHGSPAEKAGLMLEDVILKVDDEDVTAQNRFRNLIAFSDPGQRIALTVLRNGKEIIVNATLGELDVKNETAGEMVDWKPKPGGLSVAELNPQSRQHFRIPDSVKGHVVVVQVERGSEAGIAGFHPGDVILQVNRTPITSLSGFMDMYRQAKGDMLFLVQRTDGSYYRYLRNN